MGLFSRKNTSETKSSRTGARPSVSSEAQARELRVRARRRLIGALALVLAAVIVVPMLFDRPTLEDEVAVPVVVPSIVAPEPNAPLITEDSSLIAQSPSAGAVTTAPETIVSAPTAVKPPTEAPAAAAISTPPQATPAQKPVAPPSQAEAPKPPKKQERTDDGSVALALLEGRAPATRAPVAAPQKGNFILQIAAYTTAQDANTRRDRLREAGVTNAYVEAAQSGGKTTHRLRVGPFPTKEAAQAAQTRLRALGYDNGFISNK